VPPPRIAFLAPARTGDFGDVAGADSACQSAASGTIYQPLTFRAVVADSNGTPAAARLQLAQGRSIVLPGGQAVATDATFFTNTHLAPIDELIDGSVTGIGCAWTNFLPDGSNANQDDCGAWSAKQLLGAFGRTGNSDSQWAAAGPSASCGSPCHIYCIEQ
jgi:hypothetical protein